MAEERMAKGEHQKTSRPKQGGYDFSLDPGTYKVKQVSIRFGTLDGPNTFKWGLTVGPIEFKSDTKRTVMMMDDDQLPAPAISCYYQMLCEMESKDKDDEPETLITEPTLLTAVHLTT